MDDREDYAEADPPSQPVRMLAVLAVAVGIVVWCIVGVIILTKALHTRG